MNRRFTGLARFSGLIALLLFGSLAHGKATPDSLVKNIRVDLDPQRVRILYDAVGISGTDSVYIRVESRSKGILDAKTVTGDVGKALMPGKDKVIYWDYRLDGINSLDEVRVTVLVKQFLIGGGPVNALVSALVPGLGTIFVQPGRKIGLRPLITVAYGGLLIYGFSQKARSKQPYERYEDLLRESDYAEANRLHHRYVLAVGAAVLVWGTDVVSTFLKGKKNQSLRRATSQRVVISAIDKTPTVGVQFRF